MLGARKDKWLTTGIRMRVARFARFARIPELPERYPGKDPKISGRVIQDSTVRSLIDSAEPPKFNQRVVGNGILVNRVPHNWRKGSKNLTFGDAMDQVTLHGSPLATSRGSLRFCNQLWIRKMRSLAITDTRCVGRNKVVTSLFNNLLRGKEGKYIKASMY